MEMESTGRPKQSTGSFNVHVLNKSSDKDQHKPEVLPVSEYHRTDLMRCGTTNVMENNANHRMFS
eukprot:3143826-Ditylum_brightwellii.AAC.1